MMGRFIFLPGLRGRGHFDGRDGEVKILFLTRKKLYMILLGLGLLALAIAALTARAYVSTVGAGSQGKPVFQGETGEKVVALSVNVDWGEDLIPEMLKIFQENKAAVTFYVTGSWAEKHPELLQAMAQAGHSIQNHGYKHLHFNQLDIGAAQAEIKKAEEIIYLATGSRSRYFASPYGEFEDSIVQAAEGIGYRLIMWSIDTIDWQKPEPEVIVSRVMKKLHDDAIILMHPTEPTVKALPELLKQIQGAGYQYRTIEQILRAGPADTQPVLPTLAVS
jgi:probable sporulation protein (polysaccharide deacetylase family)